MRSLALAPLCALFLALLALAFGPAREAVQPVSVFVVRHAEALESTEERRDPELRPEGEARAELLARTLSRAGVTHVFASPLRRARATVEPLARLRELEVELHPAQDAAGLAAKLRALAPGSVALVAGHSNTVPALVEALGGKLEGLQEHARHGRVLADDEHGRLILVTLPAADGVEVKTIELRYGD